MFTWSFTADESNICSGAQAASSLAAMLTPDAQMILNDERLKIKSFMDYVKVYGDLGKHVELSGPNYQLILTENKDKSNFEQISFVNFVSTTDGGAHVEKASNQECLCFFCRTNRGLVCNPADTESNYFD